MELRHLRYFVVAAEEEHFHRAAERLHIVQPALSRQIRMLEEEIGVSLFERLSHGVRLSSAGKVVLEDARRILEEVDWLTARAKRAENGQIGLLRICFNAVGARTRKIPESINHFRSQFPDVELRLSIAKSQAQLEGISSGALDAGFMFDRPEDNPELAHLHIQSNQRALVLPMGHPLAKAKQIRLADLKNEQFVLVARSYQVAAYDRLMANCFAAGLSPHIAQEVNDEQTILHLVATGMGVSFIISPIVDPLPHGVVVREVLDLAIRMNLELVWLRTNPSPQLARFVETVSATLERGD